VILNGEVLRVGSRQAHRLLGEEDRLKGGYCQEWRPDAAQLPGTTQLVGTTQLHHTSRDR
jgi:hypothetical protein